MKRSPHAAQPKAQERAKDKRTWGATKPTGRPRPAFMLDPTLLPKRPPGRPA